MWRQAGRRVLHSDASFTWEQRRQDQRLRSRFREGLMAAAPRTGSDDVIGQLSPSLRLLLTLERFHLHRPDLYQPLAADPDFDVRYLPQRCAAFRLPCFWLSRRHLFEFIDEEAELTRCPAVQDMIAGERVLLPLHPLELPYYAQFLQRSHASNAADEGLHIWAVPTSSVRTLLAWPHESPGKAIFVKTSLRSPLLGDRRLDRSHIAGSVGLSALVRRSRPQLPPGIAFMHEPAGWLPRSGVEGGALFRICPPGLLDGTLIAGPLFALFGGEVDRRPFILTLLERSGMEMFEFIDEILCRGFADLWLRLALDHGLIIEAHGQDLLFGLAPDWRPRGFLYRDMEGLQIDWQLRQRRGIRDTQSLPLEAHWYTTYGTWGYPYGALAWYKLHISLFQYLHFVLHELNAALLRWRAAGLIPYVRLAEDDITALFSGHMHALLGARFGTAAAHRYNIYRSLNRFVISLMKLRALLQREAGDAPGLPREVGFERME